MHLVTYLSSSALPPPPHPPAQFVLRKAAAGADHLLSRPYGLPTIDDAAGFCGAAERSVSCEQHCLLIENHDQRG